MLSIFIVVTLLTIGVIVFFIYKPLSNIHPKEKDSNLAIGKNKLIELTKEVEYNTLTDADAVFYREELTQNLANEIQDSQHTSIEKSLSNKHKYILSIAIVVIFSVFTYTTYQFAKFTKPLEIDINNITSIEAFIAQNPEDIQAYRMLGFAYNAQNNPEKALQAYQQAFTLAQAQGTVSVTVLTEYAVALATLNQSYEGEPTQLVVRALKEYPQSPQALYLAGVIAANNADYSMAEIIWRRALSFVAEDSAQQKLLLTVLSELEEFLAQQQSQVILEVIVDIGEKTYQKFLDGYIMIFAKNDEIPMPVAISKIPMTEFTGSTTLSDENAVVPVNALSNFLTVDVIVRLSSTGMATKGDEDLEFTQKNIAVNNQTIEFIIP